MTDWSDPKSRNEYYKAYHIKNKDRELRYWTQYSKSHKSDITSRSYLRIKHNGKWTVIKKERTGVCNFCRRVSGIDCKHTQWHHYNDLYYSDITKNTIELCPTCHSKETGLGTKIGRWCQQ